ncbi:hypothetical protein LIAUS_04925 [Leptospira interrogans]
MTAYLFLQVFLIFLAAAIWVTVFYISRDLDA